MPFGRESWEPWSVLIRYWAWVKEQQRHQVLGRGPTLPVLISLPCVLACLSIPLGALVGGVAGGTMHGVFGGLLAALILTFPVSFVARRVAIRGEDDPWRP
jgi:hypothetical protein